MDIRRLTSAFSAERSANRMEKIAKIERLQIDEAARARARAVQRRVGSLSPRYFLAINPYSGLRFTACPECGSTTRVRKLPLAIHVDQFGMVILRKTCRLCTDCDMVIVHQDELEPLIARRLRSEDHSIGRRNTWLISAFDRTAGSHSLAAAGQRARCLEAQRRRTNGMVGSTHGQIGARAV